MRLSVCDWGVPAAACAKARITARRARSILKALCSCAWAPASSKPAAAEKAASSAALPIKADSASSRRFDDRYETALAEVVRAKIEGRQIKLQKRPEPTKVVSLLDALRESAGAGSGKGASRKPTKAATSTKAPAARKKAS